MSFFTDLILQTKEKYAPDARTALFDVSVRLDNSVIVLRGVTNKPEAFHEFSFALHEGYSGLYYNEIVLLPDKEAAQYAMAVVNVSVANLKAQPSHSSELASQAMLGTPLKVWQQSKGWWRVQTPDHYIAWVEQDSITLFTEEKYKAYLAQEKAVVVADVSWGLEYPEKGSRRIGDIVRGNLISVTNIFGNYAAITYPDGAAAFLPQDDIISFQEWQARFKPEAYAVIGEAFRYKGIPYLWGGTSPKGMDCSGFTKIVFGMYGVHLQRDASQQVHEGKAINLSELRPADLLFFSDRPDKRITHVAIYIGNDQYIHASGRVRVNSLDEKSPIFDAFRKETLVCARRVL
jgi:hypothetical protein